MYYGCTSYKCPLKYSCRQYTGAVLNKAEHSYDFLSRSMYTYKSGCGAYIKRVDVLLTNEQVSDIVVVDILKHI